MHLPPYHLGSILERGRRERGHRACARTGDGGLGMMSAQGPLSVLVVDDDESFRLALAKALREGRPPHYLTFRRL